MRVSTLCGGIGLACCLASAVALIVAKGPGRIVADAATQDVRVNAKNGGMARAEFVLRNPGGQPIHIAAKGGGQ